jgi:hypothetical protein
MGNKMETKRKQKGNKKKKRKQKENKRKTQHATQGRGDTIGCTETDPFRGSNRVQLGI